MAERCGLARCALIGAHAQDLGCGVGGPARVIARYSGCRITGLNNNDYQIERARKHVEREGLTNEVSFVKGDFMKLDQVLEGSSFDAVYAIESTPHAPDKTACFREVLKVLKPGGYFTLYEWCVTDQYDPSDSVHRKIKRDIEEGDSLPTLATTHEVVQSLKDAGFECTRPRARRKLLAVLGPDRAVLAARSGRGQGPGAHGRHPVVQVARWELLQRAASVQPWPMGTRALVLARASAPRLTRLPAPTPPAQMTHQIVRGLEAVHIAPPGATKISEVLCRAADALVEGGKKGIFTPMFWCLVRKPESAAQPAGSA